MEEVFSDHREYPDAPLKKPIPERGILLSHQAPPGETLFGVPPRNGAREGKIVTIITAGPCFICHAILTSQSKTDML